MINDDYGEGLTKIEKRRLAAIIFLMYKDLSRKELGKKVENFLNDKISKQDLTKFIKSLKDKEIVKTKTFDIEGKKGTQKCVFIPKDDYTLIKLIDYLYSINEVPLLLYVKRKLMYSKLLKEVDPKLITKTESYLNNVINQYVKTDFCFSNKEKQLILNVLQNSPSALHYVTKLYREDVVKTLDYQKIISNHISAEKFRKKLKDHFIFKLQACLGEDISQIGSYVPIEYTTSTKFLHVNEEELDQNYNYGVFSLQEIDGNMVKRIIRTRGKKKSL